MSTLSVRIARIQRESDSISRFTLESTDGALPSFSAGSHVILHLPTSGGEIRNAYSLIGSPFERGHYEIAVLRNPASRGGSSYLHLHACEGDLLKISPPCNWFSIHVPARRHLLIAGGIGITPFLAYLQSREDWVRRMELVYCVRDARELPFAEAIQASRVRVTVHESQVSGYLDIERLLARQLLGTHVYCCGPGGLIDAVTASAEHLGWPKGTVHFERFSPAIFPSAQPFEARLARSNRKVTVPPELSLLEALERDGVDVPYSCRIGGCGTCEIAVREGSIDHRDHCWTDDERACGKRMLACISRAKNDHLILDL